MSVLDKIFSLSCREAAILASKESLSGLSYFEKVKMRIHAKICPPCEKYAEDNELLDQAISKIVDSKSEEELKLTSQQKDKIRQAIS